MRRYAFVAAATVFCLARPAYAEVELCLAPTRLADANGDRHYRYDGHIRGQTATVAQGYGIVARDKFGNVWVQHGTGRRQPSGNVRFGVMNVSSYPLSFEIVALDPGVGAWFRSRAEVSAALSAEELSWIHPLEDQTPCTFALEDGVPVTGTCSC